jgi:uncharacterized protein YjiS (DUF1127 family)
MMSMPISSLRETESPVEPLAEPEYWSLLPEIDPELLLVDARRERDRAVAGVLRKIGRGFAWLWRNAVAGPFARWLERERTIRELSTMGELELAELGIGPGMIPYVASGKFRTDEGDVVGGGTVANENLRVRKVA